MKNEHQDSWPVLSLRSGGVSSGRDIVIDLVCAIIGITQIPAALEAWKPDSRVITLLEGFLWLVNSMAHLVGVTVLAATLAAGVAKALDRMLTPDDTEL